MSIQKKPRVKGEITYQVGWKKGKIHKKDAVEAALIDHKEDNAIVERYIWRQAPIIPASFDLYLLCVLPVICFLSILMLVYLLNF